MRTRAPPTFPANPSTQPAPQVDQLAQEEPEHRELFRRNVSATHLLELAGASDADGDDACSPPPPPRRTVSPDDTISFVR